MGIWWSSVPTVRGTRSLWTALTSRPPIDPDRAAYRRSAGRIGVRVAVVSAALVFSIIALFVAYVVWQMTPGQLREPHGPEDVHVYLDTFDLAVAVIAIGGFAVVLAGVATWLIAGRAVRPMADALRMQRTFVADAGHELRTPMTVLSARVQQLQSLVATDDPARRVLDELRDDATVLAEIVDDLLESAAGAPAEDALTLLSSELAAIERDMRLVAEQHGVWLTVDAPDAVVAVPATHLRRCVVALVDNAIGHTPVDGTVSVRAVVRDRDLLLRVIDEGTGMVGIAPRRVFDRFAHGTPTAGGSATRTGYGIGLALVRDVAMRSGGDVRVERTGATGTTLLLRLPLVRGAR